MDSQVVQTSSCWIGNLLTTILMPQASMLVSRGPFRIAQSQGRSRKRRLGFRVRDAGSPKLLVTGLHLAEGSRACEGQGNYYYYYTSFAHAA